VPTFPNEVQPERRARRLWAALARPHLAFAMLASLFGVGFAITTPPLQAPDENRHLIRAYMVARGQLLATPYPGTPQHGVAAAQIPVSITRLPERLGAGIAFHPEVKQDPARLAAEWRRPLAPEQSEWHHMPSTYSPLTYAPQAAAAALARLLGLPPVAYVYLGRAANLAGYVILVGLALRIAPAHRLALLMVALAPMAIFQAASLSPDTPGNALSWLFLAVVLAVASRPGRIARREVGALVGLAALLGLAKPPAAVLAPLALAVPQRRFESRRHRLAVGGGALAAAAATTGLWYAALAQLALPTVVVGADEAAQLRGILADPLGFAALLARTLRDAAGLYARTLVGVLGWLDTPLPGWVYPTWWAALLGVAVLDGGPASPVRGAGRAACLALAAAGGLAAVVLIYLLNPVGHQPIEGVQGRYFLPFLPLALASLHRGRGAPVLAQRAARGIPLCSAALLAVALFAIAERYYGAP
jgi:uncharacterized membrane protein